MSDRPRRGDIIAYTVDHRAAPEDRYERRRKVTATSGNFVEVYRAYYGATEWYSWHSGTLVPAHRDQRGELVEYDGARLYNPSLCNVRVVDRWFPDTGCRD